MLAFVELGKANCYAVMATNMRLLLWILDVDVKIELY